MRPAFFFVILIILIIIFRCLHVPLVVTWHPCWLFWNVFVEFSGGHYLWFVSANLLPHSYNIQFDLTDLTARSYFKQFLSNKIFDFFCFCCVFKFVSKQCSSSICKYFFLSSVSCLNNSTFLHFNLVYFLSSVSCLNSNCFSHFVTF